MTKMSDVNAYIAESVDPVETFFAHYGIKGMRWGVRRENRINRLERVGSGTATRGEKIRIGLTDVSSQSIRKNGGLQGAAANKAANMRAVNARLAANKGTLADLIKAHGGDRVVDLGGVDKGRRFTSDTAKISTKPGMSRVTQVVVKDHNTLSDFDFKQKYAVSKGTYAKRVAKYGDPYTNSRKGRVGQKVEADMNRSREARTA